MSTIDENNIKAVHGQEQIILLYQFELIKVHGTGTSELGPVVKMQNTNF
jgi:hypothetical protein